MNSVEQKGVLIGYAFNGFFLNVTKRELRYKEMLLKLENWDFEILLFLVEKHPNPAKKEEIRTIFPNKTDARKVEELTYKSISRIKKQIAFVRKNYREDTEQLKHVVIETIKNKGYCFHADVEKVYAETAETEPVKSKIEIKDEEVSEIIPQPAKSHRNSSVWKTMPWVLLVAVLSLLFGLYYFLKIENPLKIKKADIVLRLNIEEWKPLTKEQQKGNDKLFKAVVENNYKLEKSSEINSFDARVGVSKGLPPELQDKEKYQMLDGGIPEQITKEFKKCNQNQFDTYKWFRFNITNENISSLFNLNYNLNVFNSHNNSDEEFHTQVIYYPTENLKIKVILPVNKPFISNQITYSKKQICDKDYQSYNPIKLTTSDETVAEFVIESPSNKEITWHIKNPELYYMYEIKWRW